MIQVSLHPEEEHLLKVSFKPIPLYYQRIRQIAGATFDGDNKCWYIPKVMLDDLEDVYQGEIVWVTPRHEIRGEAPPPPPTYLLEIQKNVIKAPLKLPLFSFQDFGANFLVYNIKQNGFAFLCDTVGSGKTPTSLGAAEILRQQGDLQGKTLIVCKKTLKGQWLEDGIQKFTDRSGIVIDGTPAERRKQMHAAKDKDYIIVNYEQLRNDMKILEMYHFDLIIVDEAHKVKGFGNKTNTSLSEVIKHNQAKSMFLTGTPIMNRAEELYGLFYAATGEQFLGTWKEFREKYIVGGFNPRFRNFEVFGYKNLDELRDKTQPYMLRRTEKELGIELPEVNSIPKKIPATPSQVMLHEAVMEEMRATRNELEVVEEPKKREQLENRLQGFIQYLISISDTPRLLQISEAGMAKKLLDKFSDEIEFSCPKLEQLLLDVEEIIDAGHKVVIFSSFKRMAKLAAETLEAAGYPVLLIHGEVSGEHRDDAKRKFWNSDEHNILIGTDAMAEGLNLQCAKYLINIDLPWNPAILEQRIGRIRRINGHSNVFVRNYITEGLFDEQMVQAIEQKQKVIDFFMKYSASETEFLKSI